MTKEPAILPTECRGRHNYWRGRPGAVGQALPAKCGRLDALVLAVGCSFRGYVARGCVTSRRITRGRLAHGRVPCGGITAISDDRFALEVLDPLDAGETLAFGEPDQAHTLGVTSENGDFVHGRPHQRARRADQHDLLTSHDL